MDSILGYFGAKPAGGGRPRAIERTPSGTKKWVKELSPLGNYVVGQCARILLVKPEVLQEQFEAEASASAKTKEDYARNLLEYSCFRALSVSAQAEDHLNDKDFRRLSFDMMLAWDAPGATHKTVPTIEQEDGKMKEAEKAAAALGADNDEDDSALFYNDLMSMVAEVEITVGMDAFVRLGPAIPVLAELITVHPQWEALTNSTGGRLPYAVYDKYLGELDKSIKLVKSQVTPAFTNALHLSENETVIEVDGTATTQTVLQHIGVSTWPGRLTLTDYAMYFETAGVVSYGEAKKFDLAADLNHLVKAELTGPWGARLFDRAVMYKSNEDLEPLVFEFTELSGHGRRDYWLAIIREIIAAHNFARTYKLEGLGKSEALARAVLGICRLRAIRETFKSLPRQPHRLLTYAYGEEMPGGDMVMAELADVLRHSGHGEGGDSFLDHREGTEIYESSATAAVASLGTDLTPHPTSDQKPEASAPVNKVKIGEMTPLEKTIMESRDNTKKVAMAQATIDAVQMEGIGTNVAVMTELLKPVNVFLGWFQSIIQWDDPFKTISAAVVVALFIYMNWISYAPPLVMLSIACYILYLRFMKKREQFGVGEVLVSMPPGQSTVEQLLALQQALSQLEGIIQAGNIFLLKTRALLLSNYPEASNQVVGLLAAGALALAVLPVRWIALIVFVNLFTGQMKSRQESSARFNRRLHEWWYSIPVVPVRFLKPEEEGNLEK